MREVVQRTLLLAGGWFFVLLALVGLLLPLVPSTPFVLLAAFCFSRSSERIHGWLLRSPGFGPILSDWEAHGAIQPHIKLFASLLLVGLLVYPIGFLEFHVAFKALAVATALWVLWFLWSRPSGPRDAGADAGPPAGD